jgi:ubiquitin
MDATPKPSPPLMARYLLVSSLLVVKEGLTTEKAFTPTTAKEKNSKSQFRLCVLGRYIAFDDDISLMSVFFETMMQCATKDL